MIWSLGFERGAVHQCSKWSYVNEPNRSTRSLWTNLWVSRLTKFFKNPVAIIQLWNWHHFNPRTARRSWTEAFAHDPWSLWWISKECEYCLSTLSPSWSNAWTWCDRFSSHRSLSSSPFWFSCSRCCSRHPDCDWLHREHPSKFGRLSLGIRSPSSFFGVRNEGLLSVAPMNQSRLS